MKLIPDQEISVTLRCSRVLIHPDGTSLQCLSCGKTLDVHQPDADLPYRMLATCEACKGWHVVDCDREGMHALLMLLPEPPSKRESGAG